MANGRMYTVVIDAVAVSAVQDLFELTAADDKPIEIAGVFLTQSSDAGDAAAEMLRWRVRRGATTSGSGGNAATPAQLTGREGTAGFTAEINNTTQASGGTITTIFSGAFNVQAGEGLFIPEEFRPGTSQDQNILTIDIPGAPADSLTVSGTIFVREVL